MFAPPIFPTSINLKIVAYYMSGVDIGEAYVNAWHMLGFSYFFLVYIEIGKLNI